MRIFVTKPFARFARRERIADEVLRGAATRADRGVVDADLGGGVLKIRVPRAGGGKSGGYRTILLYRRGGIAFFVYGFAKSERANIRSDELAAFRELADRMLAMNAEALRAACDHGTIKELEQHGPKGT